MSGLNAAMNIALTGIEAFEQGIGTVSQNVSNQTTPGYAVESLTLSTLFNQSSGSGVASQVTRAADGFAAAQLRTATSASQAASVTASSLTALAGALANNGDVQTQINQFFQDVSALAGNPTSAAQRQTVLSDAQSVAGGFQSAASAMTSSQAGAVTALQSNVAAANGLLTQLAVINTGLGTSPNDPSLLDQQEAALNSLSSLLSVNVIPQGSNGQVLVATGGTMLLNQAGAQSLTVQPGTPSTAPAITVGTAAVPLATTANDGAIGGNIASWQAGAAALQSLNALAAIFASAVNTSQAQGVTASGGAGGALFAVPPPSVTPADGNSGGATVTAALTDASSLPTDGGPFTLTYSSAKGWSAVDQASQQSYALGQGASLSFAGLTVAISGAPADGDAFTVNPAPAAAQSFALAASSPDAVAAADPYVATAGALRSDGSIVNGNGGTITAGSSTVTNAPASGAVVVPSSVFGQPLQITFTSATDFTVTTAADPSTTIASGALSGSNPTATLALAYPDTGATAGTYWQVPMSGTPAAGDVMTLTVGGSGDGSNATRMQALWTAAGATSSGTMEQAFIGLGTGLGSAAEQATTLSGTTSAQVTTATTNLQTVGGVDINQQAVLLSQYEQAYQAAAQVISATRMMFQSILQAVQ
ncbi:FlgK family flagellar hook-associated protein [Acidisoma silvae]|uniref:Flagellar hook-associated protein 1 n=1 Tax=Acidisoma silvae TaxID=2802396 RepID=A0A963YPX6_9PROT|nr:flagellar biosynthesis protein FlgK [Acidisoma silvae]MCB8874901.1 flagellar biosynthesis protein FlgK [Acidisoma silvae]